MSLESLASFACGGCLTNVLDVVGLSLRQVFGYFASGSMWNVSSEGYMLLACLWQFLAYFACGNLWDASLLLISLGQFYVLDFRLGIWGIPYPKCHTRTYFRKYVFGCSTPVFGVLCVGVCVMLHSSR